MDLCLLPKKKKCMFPNKSKLVLLQIIKDKDERMKSKDIIFGIENNCLQ